jgi:hypothetical protein
MENLDNNSDNQYKKPDRKEKVRICPVCKQEVLIKPGMHNWKNLFRKPTIEEMITLFILLGVIAIYFAYQHDVKQYQDYINKYCKADSKIPNLAVNPTILDNITNITYANEVNQTNETLKV